MVKAMTASVSLRIPVPGVLHPTVVIVAERTVEWVVAS